MTQLFTTLRCVPSRVHSRICSHVLLTVLADAGIIGEQVLRRRESAVKLNELPVFVDLIPESYGPIGIGSEEAYVFTARLLHHVYPISRPGFSASAHVRQWVWGSTNRNPSGKAKVDLCSLSGSHRPYISHSWIYCTCLKYHRGALIFVSSQRN